MIQSDKFDSFNMDIKKITNTALNFIIERLIEILGLLISFLALLLIVALITYSPEDPNFIFPEGTQIIYLDIREVLQQIFFFNQLD